MARLLERCGTPVFALDSWGRLLSRQSAADVDHAGRCA
jgi:hypothetical protein